MYLNWLIYVYCMQGNGKWGELVSLLTSSPTASRRKLSVQETVASWTLRPKFSKASTIETSKPGQLFSENTLIKNPFSRVSTVTCWSICWFQKLLLIDILQEQLAKHAVCKTYNWQFFSNTSCISNILVQLLHLLLQLLNILWCIY